MATMATYKLLRKGNLLELHLVHTGGGGAQQRAGGDEDGRLHDGDGQTETSEMLE